MPESIEERRAKRREKLEKARDEQIAKDMEAIDALEQASGEGLHTMTANGFKPGVVVKMAFRPATSPEYKRYFDQINSAAGSNKNSKAHRDARETLAKACLVYPKDAELDAYLAEFPGALISLSIEVAKLAESASEEEGKG